MRSKFLHSVLKIRLKSCKMSQSLLNEVKVSTADRAYVIGAVWDKSQSLLNEVKVSTISQKKGKGDRGRNPF
mgnify:CR=1 FL=1